MTESEFLAVTLTLVDIEWIYSILSESYLSIEDAVVYTDNQGALNIMRAETGTAQTRHLDVKYQYGK